mgnify:CR=1 FL=1
MSNNIYDFDNFSCSARQDIMNTRTYVRNIPSQPLQPYLEARPVLTKYSIMPIVDPRREIKTPLIQQATYNPSQIFNPGFGPWSGFASNVNHESDFPSCHCVCSNTSHEHACSFGCSSGNRCGSGVPGFYSGPGKRILQQCTIE